MIKVKDIVISDDILAIVSEEIARIKALDVGREAVELVKLEKLAKTYSVIMSSTRENLKAGVYGKLSTQDLEQLDVEESDEADEED